MARPTRSHAQPREDSGQKAAGKKGISSATPKSQQGVRKQPRRTAGAEALKKIALQASGKTPVSGKVIAKPKKPLGKGKSREPPPRKPKKTNEGRAGKQSQDITNHVTVPIDDGLSDKSCSVESKESLDDDAEKSPPLPQYSLDEFMNVSKKLSRFHQFFDLITLRRGRFFTPPNKRYQTFVDMFEKMTPELRRYISCIALGSERGAEEWIFLLCDSEFRWALIAGVIGRALMEHVFAGLYFGADEDQAEVIGKVEADSVLHAGEDAFIRTRNRAELISVYEWHEDEPPLFEEKCTALALQIQTLLDPIFEANPDYTRSKTSRRECTLDLVQLVKVAAQASNAARRDPTTVYHFPRILKGDKLDRARWDCANFETVQHESPLSQYGKEKGIRPSCGTTTEREEEEREMEVNDSGYLAFWKSGTGKKSTGSTDPADNICRIVKVAIFPQCVMYRPGGGDEETKEDGFRMKHLCRGTVACCWGRWTIGKATGKGKTGADEDGFMNFADLSMDDVKQLAPAEK